MYQFIKALVKPRPVGSRWEEKDISAALMNDIFQTYIDAILILHHTVADQDYAVNINDLPSSAKFSKLTLAAWLTANGNSTLEALDVIPTLSDDRVVRYKDAFRAGYTIQPTPSNASPSANVLNNDKHWLRLTKQNLNTELFYKMCMVSVNGYFHLIDYNPDGIFVVDGNRSSQISGDAHIGIHSYSKVAEIQYHFVTAEQISRLHANIPLSKKAVIKLSQPVVDQTFILVIGGIAHYFDERVFRQINDDTIVVNVDQLDLDTWFVEADQNLDLTTLPITRIGEENHLVDRVSLYTDETIKAIFNLSQSFMVGVKSQAMYRDFKTIQRLPYGNTFISAKKPTWPIRAGGGRMAEYVYVEEKPVYAIHTHQAIRNNFLFKTIAVSGRVSIGYHAEPTKPYTKSQARFEIIGTDL